MYVRGKSTLDMNKPKGPVKLALAKWQQQTDLSRVNRALVLCMLPEVRAHAGPAQA